MILRKLELITPTGDVMNIALPDFKGYSHIDSEEEFIEILKKYSKGLKGLRNRKPELSIGKLRTFESIDEQMHCLVNARKYVDGSFISGSVMMVHQKFTLDLVKGTCTLYGAGDEEVGTLYLDAIFDNWKELFHPDLYPVVKAEVFETGSVEVEPCEEHDEDDEDFDEARLFEDYKKKMVENLDDESLELWNYCMLLDLDNGSDKMTYTIEYSGSGDSGQTDGIEVRNSDGEFTIGAKFLEEKLLGNNDFDTIIWRLIQKHEGGFYNDDGGRGMIKFSMTHFEWDHYNYIQSEDQTISWNISTVEKV